jgi:hypothetical protein
MIEHEARGMPDRFRTNRWFVIVSGTGTSNHQIRLPLGCSVDDFTL